MLPPRSSQKRNAALYVMLLAPPHRSLFRRARPSRRPRVFAATIPCVLHLQSHTHAAESSATVPAALADLAICRLRCSSSITHVSTNADDHHCSPTPPQKLANKHAATPLLLNDPCFEPPFVVARPRHITTGPRLLAPHIGQPPSVRSGGSHGATAGRARLHATAASFLLVTAREENMGRVRIRPDPPTARVPKMMPLPLSRPCCDCDVNKELSPSQLRLSLPTNTTLMSLMRGQKVGDESRIWSTASAPSLSTILREVGNIRCSESETRNVGIGNINDPFLTVRNTCSIVVLHLFMPHSDIDDNNDEVTSEGWARQDHILAV